MVLWKRFLSPVFVIVAAAIFTVSTQAADLPEVVFVKFSLQRFMFSSLPHIGKQLGFDRKYGFSARFYYAKNVPDAAGITAHPSNKNYVGMEAFGVRKFPRKLGVFGVTFPRAPYQMIARKEIKSIKDLGGKAIVTYGCGRPVGLAGRQMLTNFPKLGLAVKCGWPEGNPDAKTVYLIPQKGSSNQINTLRRNACSGGVCVVAMTAVPRLASMLLRVRDEKGLLYRVLAGLHFFNQSDTTVPMGILTAQKGFEYREEVLQFYRATIRWLVDAAKNPETMEQALVQVAFAMRLGTLSSAKQPPTKLPPDIDREEVKRYYRFIVTGVPIGICVPNKKQLIDGIQFYAGKPIDGLAESIMQSAVGLGPECRLGKS